MRATAIDALVEGWLDLMGGAEEEGVQVVCLGAGSDTRFWRLMVGKEFTFLVRVKWASDEMFRRRDTGST